MSLTMVSSNIAGWTKKQITGAALFVGYCVGNIIGPQTFRDDQAPGYRGAYIAMLVGYSVKLAAVLVLYAYMYTSNKRRDQEAARELAAASTQSGSQDEILQHQKLESEAVEAGMRDMTELDNKGFRYIL